MKTAFENRPWAFIAYHIKNYTFSPHLHNQIELVYLVSGSCTISIDNINYSVVAGNLILIFPYQIHSFSDAEHCELIVQVFEPDFTPRLLPYLGKYTLKYPLFATISPDCLEAFLKAEHYYVSQSDIHIIRGYVSLCISFLYDKFEFIPISMSDYHSVLYSLLLYVDAHYRETLTLDILAQELHVTKYYISRIFTQKLHSSFPDYINQLRVEYAVYLLQNTDFPICDIAFECGFDCIRTFYRVFKKHMNTTPFNYQKNTLHYTGR